MSDLDDMLWDDADTAPAVGDNALKSVSALGERLVDFDHEIAATEQKLEALKRDRRHLAERDLPDAMLEVGLSSFKLVDGKEIVVEPFIEAHISEANREAAHGYLRSNGQESVIKSAITAEFGKGQEEKASIFRESALKVANKVTVKEAVHPQTLKKLIRELLEAGKQVPEDTFGIFRGRIAKVKK